MRGIKDMVSGKGTVRKRIIDLNTGEVIKDFTDHNLIVKSGRVALVNVLAGKLNTSITKMAIGSGGTADTTANAFNPIPPSEGDTELADKKYIVTLATREVDTAATNPKARFVALFNCKDVNSLVNETGLILADGTTLFARHTFSTVSLLSDTNFALEITWDIEF